MNIRQPNDRTGKDTRRDTDDQDRNGSLVMLVAVELAVLAMAVWLALSVPEALDSAATAAAIVLPGDGSMIEERNSLNAVHQMRDSSTF